LKNKLGVIIGANSFIGSKLSQDLARKGNDLILVGRRAGELEQLSKTVLKGANSKIKFFELDFSNGATNYLDTIFGPYISEIDFCIITLGTQEPIGNFIDLDFDMWKTNLNLNLIVPAFLTQYFAKSFCANKKGSIVLFSGGGGTNARPLFSAYSASKTGLIRFVETISYELSSLGVRINAVAPGVMPSKMMLEILDHEEILPEKEINEARKSLNSSNYDESKIIDLCNFLISEESIGISGKLISAEWDNWQNWPKYIQSIKETDLYTLRRVTGKERGFTLGDI
jgi:3-oxoacyl-[acyl-carrier protein] reductase